MAKAMKMSKKEKKEAAEINLRDCSFFILFSLKTTWQVCSYLEIDFKSHTIKNKVAALLIHLQGDKWV